MENLLLAVARINFMWYLLPLVVAVSLVYAATRHEQPGPILNHAARIGIWITAFMVLIFGLLWPMT